MNENVTERALQSVRTPLEGMLVLARALDALEFKLDLLIDAQADPWGGWLGRGGQGARVGRRPYTPPAAPVHDPEDPPATATLATLATQIEAIRAQIAAADDRDDLRALQAKLRLLEDEGRPPEDLVPEGQRIDATTVNGEIVVELPPATVDEYMTRFEWAMDNKLGEHLTDNGVSNAQAAQWYAKGGPVWLHAYDRPAVVSMPVHWRQLFVTLVEKFSPAQAREIGRDILKDEDEMGGGAAFEKAMAEAEARRA